MRVGVDQDNDDAAAGQFNGDIGQRFLGPLETGNDHHQRRRIVCGCRIRFVQVRDHPLAVVRGDLDVLNVYPAAGTLYERRNQAGKQHHQQ